MELESPEIILLYTTCPTPEEGRTLAGRLLGRRLIARANIIPGVRSLYRWGAKLKRAVK